MKSTGVKSTSFQVWLATFVPGVAAAVQAIVTNGTTAHQAIFGLGGGGLALISTLGKLFHDNGLNKASLATAGSDVAAELPTLKSDLAKAVSSVETDIPAVKTAVDAVTSRVTALETKVPDLAGIEQTVRTVLAQVVLAKPETPTAGT